MRLLKLFSGTHPYPRTTRPARLARYGGVQGHWCDAQHESPHRPETSPPHRSMPWRAHEKGSDRLVLTPRLVMGGFI